MRGVREPHPVTRATVGSIWRNDDPHGLGESRRVSLRAARPDDRIVTQVSRAGTVRWVRFEALREALDFGTIGEWA